MFSLVKLKFKQQTILECETRNPRKELAHLSNQIQTIRSNLQANSGMMNVHTHSK